MYDGWCPVCVLQLVQTVPKAESVEKLLNASVYVSAASDASNPYLTKNLRSLRDLQDTVQASAQELGEILSKLGAVDIDGTRLAR